MILADWIALAILVASTGAVAAAFMVKERLERRKYQRKEQELLAAWKQRPRGGPLDGAGLITDEDEEILAGIEEASTTDRRPGQ